MDIPDAADRLDIRRLVDAYARCADRRDAAGQMALFTKHAHFIVFMDATTQTPAMDFHQRDDLAPVFAELNKYEATTHFIGQCTIDGSKNGNQHAVGETYCIAHHVMKTSEGTRTLFIASIRYYDSFIKEGGKWLFAERKLIVDWTDLRTLNA
jgi:hypothetical protein